MTRNPSRNDRWKPHSSWLPAVLKAAKALKHKKQQQKPFLLLLFFKEKHQKQEPHLPCR